MAQANTALSWDPELSRFIGSTVPAVCEDPDCDADITRAASQACGLAPGAGCGRYFCDFHLQAMLPGFGHDDVVRCGACADGRRPFPTKPETTRWVRHLLADPSWASWRNHNRRLVATMKEDLHARP